MPLFHIRATSLIVCLAITGWAHTSVNAKEATDALAPAAQAAAATVDQFHTALKQGDTNSAAALLTEDAVVFEAGGVERGKAEYAAQHLAADAAFAKAVPTVLTRRTGDTVGALAWIATEGRTSGTYNGKAVNRITAETMVLRKVGSSWKIVHIHWSSAAAQQ